MWLPCTNVPVGLGPIPVANPRTHTVGDQKNDESGTTSGDGEYSEGALMVWVMFHIYHNYLSICTLNIITDT